VTSVEDVLNATVIDEDGCWIWQLSVQKTRGGYAQANINGKIEIVHRWLWPFVRGPLPKVVNGKRVVLDHLCDMPRCVNPLHLDPTTDKHNVQRSSRWRAVIGSWHRAKTHCPQGHPYDEENTYISTRKATGLKERSCKACARIRSFQKKNDGQKRG